MVTFALNSYGLFCFLSYVFASQIIITKHHLILISICSAFNLVSRKRPLMFNAGVYILLKSKSKLIFLIKVITAHLYRIIVGSHQTVKYLFQK